MNAAFALSPCFARAYASPRLRYATARDEAELVRRQREVRPQLERLGDCASAWAYCLSLYSCSPGSLARCAACRLGTGTAAGALILVSPPCKSFTTTVADSADACASSLLLSAIASIDSCAVGEQRLQVVPRLAEGQVVGVVRAFAGFDVVEQGADGIEAAWVLRYRQRGKGGVDFGDAFLFFVDSCWPTLLTWARSSDDSVASSCVTTMILR